MFYTAGRSQTIRTLPRSYQSLKARRAAVIEAYRPARSPDAGFEHCAPWRYTSASSPRAVVSAHWATINRPVGVSRPTPTLGGRRSPGDPPGGSCEDTQRRNAKASEATGLTDCEHMPIICRGALTRLRHMPRPKQCRRVGMKPGQTVFKPAGMPTRQLSEVVLTVDEFESLRLADALGMYQEQAARHMRVSRQTFGRIVESARRKIASALVEGWAIRIEGGSIEMAEMRRFQCVQCGHTWEVPFGAARPIECPACNGSQVRRVFDGADQGPGRGRRCRRGRNQCGRGRVAAGSEGAE